MNIGEQMTTGGEMALQAGKTVPQLGAVSGTVRKSILSGRVTLLQIREMASSFCEKPSPAGEKAPAGCEIAVHARGIAAIRSVQSGKGCETASASDVRTRLLACLALLSDRAATATGG